MMLEPRPRRSCFGSSSRLNRCRRRSRRQQLCSASIVAVLGLSKVCLAQGVPAPGSETFGEAQSGEQSKAPTTRWYGWQTFCADGVAGAFFVGAIAAKQNTVLFGFSGVSFVVGAPVVHVAHGQWGTALGSAGMRIVAPLLGAVIGSQYDGSAGSASSGGSHDSSTTWTTAGVAIGGLAASVVDGLMFAYTTTPPSHAVASDPGPRIDPVPNLIVSSHSVAIGISGAL